MHLTVNRKEMGSANASVDTDTGPLRRKVFSSCAINKLIVYGEGSTKMIPSFLWRIEEKQRRTHSRVFTLFQSIKKEEKNKRQFYRKIEIEERKKITK